MSNTGVFKKYLKPAVIVLLLIWLGIVLSLTVLGRTPSVGNHFQPDFLWSYKYGYKEGSWFVLQMIENVIMYMPFGFLFPFLLKEKLSGWKLFVITIIADVDGFTGMELKKEYLLDAVQMRRYGDSDFFWN